MSDLIAKMSPSSAILLSLSVMLLSGFLVTRLTKLLRLPNVSGYIIAGILIGPYALRIVPEALISGMGFVNDIALAFIAFGVGRFFRRDALHGAGPGAMIITLFESLLTGAAVTALMLWVFRLELSLSLMLGVIAMATAPASTMMTIQQYRAQGHFVNELLQTIALDNVVCLTAFSVVTAMIGNGGAPGAALLMPLLYNIGAMLCGFVFGFVLSRLLGPSRSQDNRLILSVALLMALASLCAVLDMSPLLPCMVFGSAYINFSGDETLFRQLSAFTPPIMSLFFIISGMNLDLSMLGAVGAVGLSYFIVRILMKYWGAYLGCRAAGESREMRRYLGLALIPQAGVAIGLAFLTERMLPEALSNYLLAVILASSVLYELIGPAAAKYALFRSGSIPSDNKSGPPARAASRPPRSRQAPKSASARPPLSGSPSRPFSVYPFDSCESLKRPPRRYHKKG